MGRDPEATWTAVPPPAVSRQRWADAVLLRPFGLLLRRPLDDRLSALLWAASGRRLRGAATSNEGFQQGDVVIVAFALHIATVESELQRHRQAVHHSSVDQSLGEGVLGIPERLLTLGIGLPTGALRVEDDWMDIDLACAVRNECNATRSPVRLHRVTMPAERLQQVFERHLGDIDGEIEVAVDPGLTPNKCVDTPSAGNPNAVIPCPVSDTQHSPDIASGHVPASVVTDVRHHEASQAGAKLSGTGWPRA
jgi:hypothetical protein